MSASCPRSSRSSPTYSLFCLLEDRVDIIIGFPHPRDTLVVVAEALLKDELELDEHDGFGGLLVDLGAEGEPCSLSEKDKRLRVLLIGAVKAFKGKAVSWCKT